MRNDSTLLIDFNNYMYRYLDMYSNLSYHGKRTGGVYGFLKGFTSLINQHKPQSIIICNDSKPYKRELQFGNYKGDRNKGEFDLQRYQYIKDSNNYIMEFLSILNIPIWVEQGYESDDLFAIYSKNRVSENILMASNDDDLLQLLTPKVRIIKGNKIITENDFIAEYEIQPQDWISILAMKGTHNNVPNLYKGLGIATALKIFKDGVKFDEMLSSHELEFGRNIQLITLPFDDEITIPEFENIRPTHIESDREVLNFLMRSFGIRITYEMEEAFKVLMER